MDKGPFPNGRIRTFAWNDDGRVILSLYELPWNHAAETKNQERVSPLFRGVESIAMRNGELVPVRLHRETVDAVNVPALFDPLSCPYTDKGFIRCFHGDGVLDEVSKVLRFDEATGDVVWVDIDALMQSSDGGSLARRLAQTLRPIPVFLSHPHPHPHSHPAVDGSERETEKDQRWLHELYSGYRRSIKNVGGLVAWEKSVAAAVFWTHLFSSTEADDENTM